ncbi:kinase-like protein [Clavulina sp. PMI_390]|nr:kinase-like protein [Clavulina sp. PMI_390]
MAVVTPWMPNGIASMYLESHPVDLLRILRGTIDGMQYLHSLDPPIIHGSVQPRNILINSDGDPVIRDLGITRVRMEAIKSIDERIAGFSPRYQAPELMMPPKTLPDGTVRSHASHLEVSLSLAADVYSLAMTFYHFITLIQPFHTSSHPDLISPASIIRAVISGERPPAPQLEEHRLPASGGNLYDEDLAELYGILKEMWSTKPDQRPSTADVASRIMKLENRPACQGCLDAHRSTECRRATDDAPCDHCVENKAECTAPPENGGPSAAGYGLNAGNREATDGGYYITTLELPPSPEGALAPGQTLETRRVRLVPFQWQRRRRVSSSQASRSNR